MQRRMNALFARPWQQAGRSLLALLLALVVGFASVAAAAASHTSSAVASSNIERNGHYAVLVRLRALKARSQLVTLYVPGARPRRLRVYESRTVDASYRVNLGEGKL